MLVAAAAGNGPPAAGLLAADVWQCSRLSAGMRSAAPPLQADQRVSVIPRPAARSTARTRDEGRKDGLRPPSAGLPVAADRTRGGVGLRRVRPALRVVPATTVVHCGFRSPARPGAR